jgi:starch synthase
MYSAGDFILIPSRYEPCGLTQMIGMRYGCIPVARSTGGLKDTIRDLPNDEQNNGFLFDAANPLAFAHAVNRAAELFTNKERMSKMQINGMKADFSWDKSALKYARVYFQTLGENY